MFNENEDELIEETIRNAKAIAKKYGAEMVLYAKSLYWSSPRVCPNTTNSLRKSPEFKALPLYMQNEILQYGALCRQFGVGCYQERGFAADLYNKLHGAMPPIPSFRLKKRVVQKSSDDGKGDSDKANSNSDQREGDN